MNLNTWINENTENSIGVVELGAGFFKRLGEVHPSVKTKIGIEIYEEYIKHAEYDNCIKILGDALNYNILLANYDLDTVMIIDVLEHFEKDVGYELIGRLKRDFIKILLMLPVGKFEQELDVTGYGGHEYQKHRSYWYKEDINKLNFTDNVIDEYFHANADRINNNLDTGCYFGVWKKYINEDMIKIKNFWEEAQKIKNNSSLSGCQYDETIEFLKVNKFLQPQMHVLEIGVGYGYVTKGFYENGHIVSGLDISETALKNVKKYCEKTYTLNDLEKLPSNYFDIVICHNVVQHVPTDTLCEELKHIIPALKENGILAMEFVSSNDINDKGINPTQNEIEAGLLCRTPEYMKKLINDIGGESEMVVNNQCKIGKVTGCHVFHVRKRN